jgi:phage shock protein A
MGVFARLVRMCGADLHGVMDELEDKGLLLKQHLREMEEELTRKKGVLRMEKDGLKRLASERASLEESLAAVEKDADAAVERGKDDIARLLIRRRKALLAMKGRLEKEAVRLEEKVAELLKTTEAAELEFDDLKARAKEFFRVEQEKKAALRGETTDFSFLSEPDREIRDEEIELELIRRKERLERKRKEKEEEHENI